VIVDLFLIPGMVERANAKIRKEEFAKYSLLPPSKIAWYGAVRSLTGREYPDSRGTYAHERKMKIINRRRYCGSHVSNWAQRTQLVHTR
jgi:hypothetical protein